MNFVMTPLGLIMDADNHQKMVDLAKSNDLGNVLGMLLPAEPIDPAEMFSGIDRQTSPEPWSSPTTSPLMPEAIKEACDRELRKGWHPRALPPIPPRHHVSSEGVMKALEQELRDESHKLNSTMPDSTCRAPKQLPPVPPWAKKRRR